MFVSYSVPALKISLAFRAIRYRKYNYFTLQAPQTTPEESRLALILLGMLAGYV